MAEVTREITTLQNCEDELIRIPGSIQRHGFLLVLDRLDQDVVAASENAEEFLGIPLKLILGASLATLLDRELLAALRATSTSDKTEGLLTFVGSFKVKQELMSVVTHRVDGQRVLEFEQLDRLVGPELMNSVITNFVATLSTIQNKEELLDAITKQVKDLTGFERVVLYQFDEAGHGTVLTEENDGILPRFLGLRFPASDIPQQARALYVLNTVRIIPNAEYVPSPLRAMSASGKSSAVGDGNARGMDMSMCLLRSVSPIHLEYMRNMGTASSMSISILCEGKLWGLISGHHSTPRSVPYLVRSACDLLTKMVSSQLVAFRTASRLEKIVQFHAVQRRILTHMAAENDYVAAITAQMGDVVNVTAATGAALLIDGQCQVFGHAPDEAAVRRLAGWLDRRPDLPLFESRHLVNEIDWADEIQKEASGLLAIRISDVRQSYLMWFRQEMVAEVNWAGDPDTKREGNGGLNPRESFHSWKELERGRSTQWSEVEIESALDFRTALMTISLKRAEEAAELSEARFQQLTHSLPSAVWTADDDAQLTYANRRWTNQGLEEHGCWFQQLGLTPEEEAKVQRDWSLSVSEGVTFESELPFRSPTGETEQWNLVRAVPFLRANRTRAGWVGTCTDLTDRRDREVALRMAEKLALTGRMTNVIAHEINNPLEALTNILYLLNNQAEGDESMRRYIDMAQYELERISGITKQTLRWSKESVQQAEMGEAGALFEDVLRLFSGKIRNRQIHASVLGGQEVPFYGVVGQIRQVVANLVSNALDAVPEGGHVWLSAAGKGSMMEIEVRDDGSGMSEETRRQILNPFFSTKGDLGNGLGLYISNEIVERHGGEIVVESALGVGTAIRVQLPLLAS